MTYSAPFPLVQFQFQGFPRFFPRQPRIHMTSLWNGPMEGSALSLRRRSQDSIPRLRSGLFASQFREICNLQVVTREGRQCEQERWRRRSCSSRFARPMLGLILPTRRGALVAAWKDADPNIAALAEVIASAFASGMWAGAIEGRPVYCPPSACASFRHALGGVGGDAASLGVPQDCWFDAALSGAQVFKARAPGFSSLSCASARVPAPLGRRGVYRL